MMSTYIEMSNLKEWRSLSMQGIIIKRVFIKRGLF
jgi:hypothetical protein